MIKSIDKLREKIQLDVNNPWSDLKGDLLSLCDEVEAEISEKHMELPTDADGVPIHVGERMRLDNGHEGEVWLIGAFDIMMSDHICFDWAMSRHVKPRTIEDVLLAFYHDASDADVFCTTKLGKVVSKYAGEIRELLGVSE